MLTFLSFSAPSFYPNPSDRHSPRHMRHLHLHSHARERSLHSNGLIDDLIDGSCNNRNRLSLKIILQ